VHAFSHYRLSVQPLAAVLRVPRASVRDGASARWADAAALPGIGLPAPVRKLLNAYLETA
jgi:A/G-specific adenine glycosylase